MRTAPESIASRSTGSSVASDAAAKAADKLLTEVDVGSTATERLDFTTEFNELANAVNATARLAGIVVTLYSDLLRQKTPIQAKTHYINLMLTQKMNNEFLFIIQHLCEMADNADEACVRLEELGLKYALRVPKRENRA